MDNPSESSTSSGANERAPTFLSCAHSLLKGPGPLTELPMRERRPASTSVPVATVSASRTQRMLNRRASSHCYYDSDDTETDDDCRVPRRQQQQLPPYSPKLSLRRILEQRNLVPVQGERHTTLQGHRMGSARGTAETRSVEPLMTAAQQHPVQLRPDATAHVSSSASVDSQPARGGFGHSRRPTMTAEQRRRARTCTIEGCSNYIVDHHLCFRHGGGRRCSIEGCTSSAKQFGLCWRHGGSVLCKVEGCTRGVKVKGFCWAHGGGKKKKMQAVESIAQGIPTVQQVPSESPASSLCCLFEGCQNAPILYSFCNTHSREVARPGYVFEL